MVRTFRIHPAFGIARVGDSPDGSFIGPEVPGVFANWDPAAGTFDAFKKDGLIKRQGVRFRVFEFQDGVLKGEVLPGKGDIISIEWTVHVANLKASFFKFDGPAGEDGDFSGNGRRNDGPTVVANRATLEIDPGPKSIVGESAGPVLLEHSNPMLKQGLPDLGELRTDDQGRLVFLGGHGRTFQAPGAGAISDYVNNDGWFDDVCDGPVSAKIEIGGPNGVTKVDAMEAWVSVGPPDFAPSIANVVSLYDTMWDVAVRNSNIPIPDLDMFRAGGTLERLRQQRDDWTAAGDRFTAYQPSFVDDIANLLNRALGATSVHSPPPSVSFHSTIDRIVWGDLADPAKGALRKDVFARLRDPDGQPANSDLMPRGLGDQFVDEADAPDPQDPRRLNSKRFFSLTRVQYAMFRQWAADIFRADGTDLPIVPIDGAHITPEGLDRASLENAVGGPFFPGIEVSWLIRNPAIYAEPFRVKRGATVGGLTVGPGFFSQQMALPWQADFRDCKRESLTNPVTGTPTYAMWWAGQRPDDVYAENVPDVRVPWLRPPQFAAGDDDDQRYVEMVQHWSTIGFIAKLLDDGKWVEVERTP